MFTLIVKNPAGQIYVTETFESQEALNKWLLTEQSRPYWQKDFTVEVVDKSAEAQAQAQAQAAERAAREASVRANVVLAQEIQTLSQKRNRTPTETNDLLDKVCALLGKLF